MIIEDVGITNGSALAVVQAVSSGLNADGEEATRVKFLQGKEVKTLSIDEDTDAGSAFASDVKVGDIFQYTAGGSDEISKAYIIFSRDKMALGDYAKEINAGSGTTKFAFGVVQEYKNWNLVLNDTLPADEDGNIDKTIIGKDFSVMKEEGNTLAVMDLNKLDRQPSSAIQAVSGLRSASSSFKPDRNRYVAVVRVDNGDTKDVVQIIVENDMTVKELGELSYDISLGK